MVFGLDRARDDQFALVARQPVGFRSGRGFKMLANASANSKPAARLLRSRTRAITARAACPPQFPPFIHWILRRRRGVARVMSVEHQCLVSARPNAISSLDIACAPEWGTLPRSIHSPQYQFALVHARLLYSARKHRTQKTVLSGDAPHAQCCVAASTPLLMGIAPCLPLWWVLPMAK